MIDKLSIIMKIIVYALLWFGVTSHCATMLLTSESDLLHLQDCNRLQKHYRLNYNTHLFHTNNRVKLTPDKVNKKHTHLIIIRLKMWTLTFFTSIVACATVLCCLLSPNTIPLPLCAGASAANHTCKKTP